MSEDFSQVPPGFRCSFCHSFIPLRRVEVNTHDGGYEQRFRFFCNATCQGNWETNQPHAPAQKDLFSHAK